MYDISYVKALEIVISLAGLFESYQMKRECTESIRKLNLLCERNGIKDDKDAGKKK
jgi:hypothetical protein